MTPLIKPLYVLGQDKGKFNRDLTICKLINLKHIIKLGKDYTSDYNEDLIIKIKGIIPAEDFITFYAGRFQNNIFATIDQGAINTEIGQNQVSWPQAEKIYNTIRPAPLEILVKCRYEEQAVLIKTMLSI